MKETLASTTRSATRSKTSSAPELKKFTDYRAFLVAYAQDAKKRKGWSYNGWASRLGLKSASSITKIIQGQREPGEEITEKLVSYFKFAPHDAAYFRNLVQLQKLKNQPQLSVLLREKMSQQFPQVAATIMDAKTFALISNWYHMTIREMTRLSGFSESPEWIARKLLFKVPNGKIRAALASLLEAGLLERHGGSLRPAHARLHTTSDVSSEAVRRYHRQMLSHAADALELVPVEEREFSGTVMVISSTNVPKAKKLIREFRDQFAKLLEEDGGDVAYQLQMQFFPLTKGLKNEN